MAIDGHKKRTSQMPVHEEDAPREPLFESEG